MTKLSCFNCEKVRRVFFFICSDEGSNQKQKFDPMTACFFESEGVARMQNMVCVGPEFELPKGLDVTTVENPEICNSLLTQ